MLPPGPSCRFWVNVLMSAMSMAAAMNQCSTSHAGYGWTGYGWSAPEYCHETAMK